MSIEQTTTEQTNWTLSPCDMADWLGLPVAEVNELAGAGHLVRDGDRFPVKASVQAYIAHLLNIAADEIRAFTADEVEIREASRMTAEAVVKSAMRELHPDREPPRG